MRQPEPFLLRLYAAWLYLYPPGFRKEFAEEMKVVFTDGIYESRQRGFLAMGSFFLRELADLPGNLLREHWFELLGRVTVMSAKLKTEAELAGGTPSNKDDYQPASWFQASLAGLPHLLMALILIPSVLMAYGFFPDLQSGWNDLGIVWAGCLGLLTLVLLIYAWQRGWPSWGASWYVYGVILALAGLLAIFHFGESNRVDVILGVLLFTFFPFGMALFFYLVARKDHIKGLLLALPFMAIFWFVFLEFISNRVESLFTLLAFLFSGLVAVAIVRLGDWKLGVWLAIGLTLISGLGATYAYFYHTEYPIEANYSSPLINLSSFADFYLPQLLGSTTLILGPLLLWSLWRLSKRSGHMGVLGYNLLFSGMLLNFAAIIGKFWFISQNSLWVYNRYASSAFDYGGLLGMLLVVSGSLLLVLAAWYNQIVQSRIRLAWLVLVSLGLPWVFVMIYVALGTPNAWVAAIQPYKFTVYGLGILWAVLTGWLVTHFGLYLSQPVGGHLNEY